MEKFEEISNNDGTFRLFGRCWMDSSTWGGMSYQLEVGHTFVYVLLCQARFVSRFEGEPTKAHFSEAPRGDSIIPFHFEEAQSAQVTFRVQLKQDLL